MYRHIVLSVWLVIFALGAGGCASQHMKPVPENEVVTKPSAGKSLVIFLRPSSFGGAIQSTLYDNDEYIGTLSAKKQIAYETQPGEHLFMVVGESADFMRANLLADKTYYAAVVARMGVWKARFSFRPQNGQISQEEMQQWIAGTQQVRIDDTGLAWAKENAGSIKEKKAEYLPQWEAKSDGSKQILEAGSGQ